MRSRFSICLILFTFAATDCFTIVALEGFAISSCENRHRCAENPANASLICSFNATARKSISSDEVVAIFALKFEGLGLGWTIGEGALCMQREDGADDEIEVDLSFTLRRVRASRVPAIVESLRGLTGEDRPQVPRGVGPNPYVVVDEGGFREDPGVFFSHAVAPSQPPAFASEQPEVRREPASTPQWRYQCAHCDCLLLGTPEGGLSCPNGECIAYHRPAGASDRREPEPQPAPEPAREWGPICRAVKKERSGQPLQRCSQRRIDGKPFCSQWHENWDTRGGGQRSIDSLSAVERSRCNFSFA